MKYHEERDVKTLEMLERAKGELPPFCNRFFLGVSQTTASLTRLNYAYDLKVFFTFLTTEVAEFVDKELHELDIKDLEMVETFHIELFTDWLSLHIKSGKKYFNHERAKERKLSCLRSFFSYYFKMGELSANIMPNVDLPKVHNKGIIRLESDEVSRILAASADKDLKTFGQQRFHDATALRDYTILFFFLSTGLRISELVGLNVSDIDLKHASFKITRKGGNQTILYMSDELVKQLSAYFETTGARNTEDPLFKSLQGTRFCVRAVQLLVKKYASVAVPLKKISPHKLRSTFGTNLYRETKDIYVVADVLGHADVNTTKKHYAAQSDDIRRAAARKVKVNS